MTTRRISILFAFVIVGFSLVYLLPKSAAQPSGIKLDLPATIGDWWGRSEAVTKKEIETLGKGTEFARKVYKNNFMDALPGYEVLVSIVLSGHDMSNSIHRPERCLVAQGWTNLESTSILIEEPGKGKFPVTRLQNRRTLQVNDEKKSQIIQEAYTYYWFVGDREITSSHFGRTFTDNRDRFLRGVNQRWAFISVTGRIPMSADPRKAAELAADPAKRAELAAWTDKNVREFIKQLAPHIHKEHLKYE